MPNPNEFFEYRDGCIYWKIKPSIRTNPGDRAGYAHNDGYRQVSFCGRRILEHRIIWVMHNGVIPQDGQIDHINHIRNENHIENLRIVSPSENSRNTCVFSSNTSGVMGVNFHKASGKWRARININKQRIDIGYFDEMQEAIIARLRYEHDFGYHHNHGKVYTGESQ